MKLVLRFWGKLAVWSGLLLAMLITLSLATGQSTTEVGAHLPTWAGLAMALAAFPAGAAVAFQVFAHGRFSWSRSIQLFGATSVAAAAMFTLGNEVGPRMARASSAPDQMHEASTMTLGQLRQSIEVATARAEAASAGEAVRAWQEANALVWHYVRRTDGAALPILFGLIGALAGFWAPRMGVPKLAHLQLWAMGLFLLMSTYLAGENSYELIVMRSSGPMYFAGDMVLIVPLVLLVGLGWPTVLTTWKAEA